MDNTPIDKGSSASDLDWRQLHRNFPPLLLVWFGVALVLWVLSLGLTVYWFQTWTERSNFGQAFGAVGSLFSGFAFGGVVIALLLQNHALRMQLRETSKEHDWNRRRSAHEIITESSLGRFGELRRSLEEKIDIYGIHDRNQTWATVQPQLSPSQTLQLDAALNYLENICLSIKNGVLDEEIVYQALSEILVAYWRWAKPYIEKCRETNSDFWCAIDLVEQKWRERSIREKAQAGAEK